jgi:hypothetical protein
VQGASWQELLRWRARGAVMEASFALAALATRVALAATGGGSALSYCVCDACAALSARTA